MTGTRSFLAAAALAVVACTDNPNPSPGSFITDPPPPPPSRDMIVGRISVSGTAGDLVVELTDARDIVYRLLGNQLGALASVDGGDVIARGTFDANPGFVVDEFQVTGMYGRPALDGVLEATEDGFALRLSDNSLRVVPGLDSDCAEYVGARLWVIGWDDDSEVVFGVIGAL